MSMSVFRDVVRKDFRRKYPWEDLKPQESFRYESKSSGNLYKLCGCWSYKLNRRFIYFKAADGRYYVTREK